MSLRAVSGSFPALVRNEPGRTGEHRPAISARRRRRLPEGACPRRAGNDETPRQHLVRPGLGDWFRFARHKRLVDFEAVGGENGPVDNYLVARVELEHVIDDHLFDGEVDEPAVAPDAGGGGCENRLSDQGCAWPEVPARCRSPRSRQDDPEEAVLRRPDKRHHYHEAPENGVEPGQDVRSKDLAEPCGW